MERRVLRKEGKGYIELPDELAQKEQVELFALKPGYYLLSIPLEQRSVAKPSVSDLEKRLLQKLSNIKFYLRTVPQVQKLLGKEEWELLQGLVKKDYVNIFQSKKYPEGVYNISDVVYPLLAGDKGSATLVAKSTGAAAPASIAMKAPLPTTKTASTMPSAAMPNVLVDGYGVFEDARAAGAVSEQLRKLGKANSVKGIKGFDGKFYMVSKSYFTKAMPVLMEALEEPRNVEDLAKTTKLPAGACLAMLRLLSEDGEVVEKKRGVFAKA